MRLPSLEPESVIVVFTFDIQQATLTDRMLIDVHVFEPCQLDLKLSTATVVNNDPRLIEGRSELLPTI
jgi:hypothetical protein